MLRAIALTVRRCWSSVAGQLVIQTLLMGVGLYLVDVASDLRWAAR